MKHQNNFSINEAANWDNEINWAVVSFYNAYHKYPTILLGSNKTYAEIDDKADRSCVFSEDGKRAKMKTPLVGFNSDGYSLHFCIDDKMPRKALALVYDSEAELVSQDR